MGDYTILLSVFACFQTGCFNLFSNRRPQGGVILHCDATVEGNSPHLFTGLDELSGVILDNVKLPSENAACRVGQAVFCLPPHGTVQAAFPHTALQLVVQFVSFMFETDKIISSTPMALVSSRLS